MTVLTHTEQITLDTNDDTIADVLSDYGVMWSDLQEAMTELAILRLYRSVEVPIYVAPGDALTLTVTRTDLTTLTLNYTESITVR